MNYKYINGNLVIYLIEQIDSTNAEEVGIKIDEIRADNADGSVILDMENTRYISSAGLRQILRLKKSEKDLKIINVSNEVYDVFEMTGFSEMIDIEKAYRKMSVDGCEIVGEGSNGIVYRINDDTIIKVYRNSDALDDIKKEREKAKTALVLGINTAIPFDVVKIGDKFGSVFELLKAKTITELIKENPADTDKYIGIFVKLLKEIHSTKVDGDVLPSAKEQALSWVEWLKGKIDDDYYTKVLKLVENVKEDNHMVHGDYHTSNVHYDGKEPVLIDMDTLSVGNPVFEFSSIYLAFKGYGEADHKKIEDFIGLDYDTCDRVFDRIIHYYFNDKDDEYINTSLSKAKVVAYTRLLRRTLKRESDNVRLIECARNGLISAIDSVEDISL